MEFTDVLRELETHDVRLSERIVEQGVDVPVPQMMKKVSR